MSATIRRSSRQSAAVYTTLRVISHQMPPWGRMDKLSQDKSNLPEGSLQQYESLTDGPSNQGLNIQFLFGPYSRRLEYLIQDL